MSFKLNLDLQQAFALPTHQIFSVKGRDARVFLQAQLMNDVNSLSAGQWQYTGILNPQGRVLALFQLAEINNEHYMIIMVGLEPGWLVEHLMKFLFRSKVTITHENQGFVQGRFVSEHSSINSEYSIQANELQGYTIEIPDKYCTRQMQICLKEDQAQTNAQCQDDWHCLDMANGWLWIDTSLQNLWTPQMLSLQNIPAFSLKKGCYPGQEVVARTHYLGKSKRNLRLINGLGFEKGQSLLQNANEIGKIANCNQSGTMALAVLPLELNLELPISNHTAHISFNG